MLCRLKIHPKNIFLVAIILLAISTFLPVWLIYLEAPQYPETLGMYIYLDTITGVHEDDLENINLLNHYIGMKKIEPNAIPELRYMKWIAYAFVASGLLIYLLYRRIGVLIWTICIMGAAGAALYDFYLWEVDYGTHLDPHAPLKLRHTYIPPLIGTKQLLNITASSFPAIGGWLIVVSILLAIISVTLSFCPKPSPSLLVTPPLKNVPSIFLLISLLTYCTPQVEPIHYNQEECYLCKMLISNERFGGELITKNGKVYKFDSIECLMQFLGAQPQEGAWLYTVDYSQPRTLILAEKAFFLHTDAVSSPMGANILSFAHADSLEVYKVRYGGEEMSFSEVKDYLLRKGF